MEERKEKIRILIKWMDEQFKGFPLWAKLNPCEADAFWIRWDALDAECLEFIEGRNPVEMVRELAKEIIGMVK